MEKTYQYLVTRTRNGKTRYFFNNGGVPKQEISLGADKDIAIKEWKTLIKNRKETVPSKRKAISSAKKTIVPANPYRRAGSSVTSKSIIHNTARTTWVPTTNHLPFIPRPLSEIYVNYIHKKVITPFDLKAWNKDRVSVMNPKHPNYRQ